MTRRTIAMSRIKLAIYERAATYGATTSVRSTIAEAATPTLDAVTTRARARSAMSAKPPIAAARSATPPTRFAQLPTRTNVGTYETSFGVWRLRTWEISD